jgi:GLPGLI family protein
MKKNGLLILCFISTFFFSQQIHVKYLKVLSPFATSHEDLYIRNNQILSIQDSVIVNNNLNGQWEMGVNIDKGRKPAKQFYVSDLNNEMERNIFFTSNVDSREFFIYDKVPKPDWVIEENQIKLVAGYKCIKATGIFRGSKVIAYFAKDLPYSTGPYKFYGLPGLILDIRVENSDQDIWKAELVVIDDKKSIVFKPNFLNKDKISLKEYVNVKEAYMNKIFDKVKNSIPASANAQITTNQRLSVEKKYEWE